MPDSHPSSAEPAASHADSAAALPAAEKPATTISPVVAMTFVIVVLLTVFVVMRVMPQKDSAELAKLAAELEAVSRQGSPSVGLAGGEQIGDIAARVRKDAETMVTLAERYQQLVDGTHAELQRANGKLLQSEQFRQQTTDDLLNVRKELERSKSATYEADSLRREVAGLKTLRDEQAKQLAALQSQLAATGDMASKDDLATLQRQLDEARRAKEFFESRNRELEAAVAQQQQKLFAKSEDELLLPAIELVRTLRKLENKPDLEITKAYSEIGATLKAEVVRTLNFPTGSAQLNPADVQPVRELFPTVPDGDLLLVVGYASETGNVDSNRTLSSDRATGVAELLNSVKRPGQKVQAVYLGQTDRFGSRSAERNQCCEIWHIRAN
jgi:outer membrane protein OmpA-like peptidoglycan-associated protein